MPEGEGKTINDIILVKLDAQGEKLNEVYVNIGEIRTVLLGVPSTQNGGIVGTVNGLRKDHEKLKQTVWVVIAVLAGSGILGISIAQVLK